MRKKFNQHMLLRKLGLATSALLVTWFSSHQSACGQEKASAKLIFSTTYDCPDWAQGQVDPKIDGLRHGGGWTTRDGSREQITADANYPGGGGGKGQRHWKGDGTNNNSGGLSIELARPEPELWVRWYMRYQQGFRWKHDRPHYDKILYIFNERGEKDGCQIIPDWIGDGLCIAGQGGGDTLHCTKPGTGWQAVMGGAASDGKWHCYEIHIKTNSEGKRENKDGIGELWIDGVQRHSFKDASFPGRGWVRILVGSNQNCPENGRDMYVDYDDIAVSTAGYIGPISRRR